MNSNKSIGAADAAWEKILKDYNVVQKIKDNGFFSITSDEIKKYREARLMSKWDSSSSLPNALKGKNLNILPTSRGSYIISDFILYEPIPEIEKTSPISVNLPVLETLDINDINSEAKAINFLVLSRILDDFLETDENIFTFNGRMGTKKFDFNVDSYSGEKRFVQVDKAQIEIDGGFENTSSVVIMEAKNVLYEDFHIRQLYYPYRLWKEKVNKPIRLVFSIYSNKIYRLLEYRFSSIDDYSSIELIRSKNYSLEETKITISDLKKIRSSTNILTDDKQAPNKPPFIQADSFPRIISLLENLYENDQTENEISELMQFHKRQSGYYYNAGKYLGIFEKVKENNISYVKLTKLGKAIYKMNYRDRQLKLVSLMFEHQIFSELFDDSIEKGSLSTKEDVIKLMKKYNVCSDGVLSRRADSVSSWLNWIFKLTEI